MADAAADFTGFNILHTMLRVRDLDKSLDFYTRLLGMRLLRRLDFDGPRFTLAFVGYQDLEKGNHIELTHNWDHDEPYELGDGFGHLALAVPDVYGVCQRLESEGVEITRPAGPMMHGGPVLAFIKDPEGYSIELVQLDSDPG